MSCYVGMLVNTLPLPGGIGGVEGGLIGAFLAFGVNPSLAVLAVLAYRTISYWLPTVPGVIAYLRLQHTVGDWRSEERTANRLRRGLSPRGPAGNGCQVRTVNPGDANAASRT
jgi:hypothetical protein